jgi:hypothetical protein
MEWYTILAILLIIILAVILGVILACMLAGQRCTVTVQQRRPNHELTKVQQEQERKRQKKLSSRLKRTFRSSSKGEQPIAPVEDVKTVEFTLKLGDNERKSEEVQPANESTMMFLPKPRVTKEEIEAREKKRDEIRKKYNIQKT